MSKFLSTFPTWFMNDPLALLIMCLVFQFYFLKRHFLKWHIQLSHHAVYSIKQEELTLVIDKIDRRDPQLICSNKQLFDEMTLAKIHTMAQSFVMHICTALMSVTIGENSIWHKTLSTQILNTQSIENNECNKHQGVWGNTKIQFKYEKIKFHDLFNRSMEIVFQKRDI